MWTSTGRPTVALADINVSLTSSQENVGEITASVVIPAGETYAIANFTTTHTAGMTTITATTTGLTTASTAVTTVIAVGYPTHLVITAVPNTVPASAASTGNLILELEDDVGLPAKGDHGHPDVSLLLEHKRGERDRRLDHCDEARGVLGGDKLHQRVCSWFRRHHGLRQPASLLAVRRYRSWGLLR